MESRRHDFIASVSTGLGGGGGGWMRSSQIKGETRLSCTMGDLMGGQERKVGLAAQKLTTLDRGRRFLFWTIRQTAVHRPPWYAR